MQKHIFAVVLVVSITCFSPITARAETLTEDFNAGIPSARWTVVNESASDASWSIFAPDAAGGLRISKSADNDPSHPWIQAGLQSRFLLDGNFMASVGFNLLAFPLADASGWNEALIIFRSPTTDALFECLRLSDYWNQGVEGFSSVPPQQIGNRTDFTTVGRLGVTRNGSTMTAWIDRGNGPVSLGSRTSSQLLGPMAVSLIVLQGAYEGVRPHNALDVRYDDFAATADTIIVPEPTTLALLLAGTMAIMRRRHWA